MVATKIHSLFSKTFRMFIKIIVFIIIVCLAFLAVRFRFIIADTLGEISFFNRFFGSTENGIVIISVFAMLFSLMYLSGHLDGFILNTLGKLF